MELNGDLSLRVAVDTDAMSWTASPSKTVYRKRLHLVGAAEAGQVTSVVRYAPGASFHAHDHPEGEEILVLEGILSDEQGDWPAGTYLLNPEGFRHAPGSEPGCLLFVKLRQYPGTGRAHLALDTTREPWSQGIFPGPGPGPGVEFKMLYSQDGYRDTMRLERWSPGTQLGTRVYSEGVEVFVLEGSFEDEDGKYGKGSWLRLPPGGSHAPGSTGGCQLYVKEAGMVYQRSSSTDKRS